MPSKKQEAEDTKTPLDIGVVVLAAGRGTRAGKSPYPKQYRPIAGESVISRTLKAFTTWKPDCTIVIVHHPDDIKLLEASIQGRASMHFTVGGQTRQDSALRGLRFLAAFDSPPSHVLIHDGVRPFTSQGLLQRISASLKESPEAGVVPVIPMSDTVKETNGDGAIICTVERDVLCRAQTPQAFPLRSVLKAHERARQDQAIVHTDDSSVCERAGMEVRFVRGDPNNIKLTFPEDFLTAERMFQSGSSAHVPDIRVGHGYDSHRWAPGDGAVICGVRIPHDQAILGHSDADVGLHALTDAILGTVGADDIGTHFPPSDPEWKGASSDIFLRHSVALVTKAGGVITHLDVSIVCERPPIGPHRDAMKEHIAGIVGIDAQRISVKASTNEGMGWVGREEGILALATATVVLANLR